MTFDDSLPALVDTLVRELGSEAVTAGLVLRDGSGQLAFVASAVLTDEHQLRLERVLRERLGHYARPDRVIISGDAPGAKRLLADDAARAMAVGTTRIRYADRRIVGAEWLHAPATAEAHPPRFVFSSLKGGVGRSTALSVVAAEQARRGRNVLVVDLDLEAPGIGSMLLTADRRPPLGALDYLVERNLGPVDRRDLDDCVGTSGLTSGQGLVDVVPVVGTRSDDAPANYLAKLARGMIEAVTDGQEPVSVTSKVSTMLEELQARRRYDLVLIDARAGLAELAASPLLGLGANVLLFGTPQRQTLEGLTFLFAHLASLVAAEQPSPWQGLKMVHAKVRHDAAHKRFKDQLWELFSTYLYEEQDGLEEFNFDADDPDAPHNPLPIPLDTAFADWDPAEEPSNLVASYYQRTFSAILEFVEDILRQEAS